MRPFLMKSLLLSLFFVVMIARTILAEPFTGQDPISMGVLVRLIRELNDALSLTSIVVSHDVQEIATVAD